MKTTKNISIRERIYWSFSLLVILFIVNGVVTLFTMNSNKKLATNIFKVIAPSSEALDDFKKMMLESKMYVTNWVFLRSNEDDKKLLNDLHNSGYGVLKARINQYAGQWRNPAWVDSLNKVYAGFEELLAIEKSIMNSLREFRDYDDPVIKLEAERKVAEVILPRTTELMTSLGAVHEFNSKSRAAEARKLERSSLKLRALVILLTITIILAGFLLSLYMTRVIISPVNRINRIINNLGRGIIARIDHPAVNDEIGRMVGSVNNLSEKLQATATFAQQVGMRNFSMPFKPLSDEDTLGKAVIAMRDNLKLSDEKLNEAQHIARLGSWERDIATDHVTLTDEMFNIFDIDPFSFDFRFQGIVKLVHPDDIAHVTETMRKNRYLDPVPFECRIITRKGVTKDILIETKLVLGKNGEVEKTFGIVQDITDRKKARRDLDAVNRELNILFNSIDDVFFSVNMVTSNVIQISASCEKLYGYPQSAFLSNPWFWFDLIHPDDVHVVENEDEKMKRGELVTNQYRIISKDQTVRWIETKITPTLDAHGILVRIDGVTRDISQRKKAEEELIQKERYNRNLFDQSPVGLALSQMDGILVDANEAYINITGYSMEEIRKLSYYEITPEKYIAQEAEQLKNLESSGRYGPYEKEYIHKEGHLVPVVLSGTILERDGVKYIWSSVEDITERKKAETKLNKSEERYRQIVETAQEGIWLIDENLKTKFVNKKVCEMLGYSPVEMLGKDLFDFMDEGGRRIATESLAKQKQNGTDHLDFRFLTKEGEVVWAYLATSSVLDDQGNYIGGLAMVTDITKRKLDESLLRKSELTMAFKNKELEHKNKELEQFAYIASHDLQEPLRTISSFVDLLQRQYLGKLDKNADKFLTYISQSSERMKTLINDLLEYSRIGMKKQLEEIDCNNVVQEIMTDLGQTIKEKQAEIHTGKLPVITGYRTEIKQLFQNLIVNAIKFAKKDTVPQVSITAGEGNTEWTFVVRDNGIGIAEDHRERIFIIFQRLHTRTEYEGSGIGLAHCRKIAGLHHGRIWVESVAGEGSTFYFSIPKNSAGDSDKLTALPVKNNRTKELNYVQ